MLPGASEHRGSAAGGERDAGAVLLGLLAGSSLLPFLQAIATKGGEDVYAKIRGLLSRRAQSHTSGELEESGTVTLMDPERRIVLCLPSQLTPEQAITISNVMVSTPDCWHLVNWDEQVKAWRVRRLSERPTRGLDVTDETQ